MLAKISKRHMGAPRFAGTTHGPSPVTTYTLSKEEIEARYGHIEKPTDKPPVGLKWENMKQKQEREKREEEMMKEKELTKEKYLELKEQGLSDAKIMAKLNIPYNQLNALKKEWDVIGVRIDTKKNNEVPYVSPKLLEVSMEVEKVNKAESNNISFGYDLSSESDYTVIRPCDCEAKIKDLELQLSNTKEMLKSAENDLYALENDASERGNELYGQIAQLQAELDKKDRLIKALKLLTKELL